MRTRYHSSPLVGVLLCWALLLPGGCGRDGKKNDGKSVPPQPDAKSQTKEPVVEPGPGAQTRKPDYSLTAVDFTKEFIVDNEKASKKYEKKIVEITGEVGNVSPESAGKDVIVGFEGAKREKDGFQEIHLFSKLQRAYVAKGIELSEKQKVKITGDFAMAGPTVLWLQNGVLQELTKSETVIVDASDLVKEFSKDSGAATVKYHAKMDIIVTGEVIDLTKKDGFRIAKLKGDGKTLVALTVDWESANLKKGQIVRFRSWLPFPPKLENGELSIDGCDVAGVK